MSPLNLHWAGVGLLALVNLYLLAHMALLWHGEKNYNADAQAEQRMELKTAEAAAVPLRGLDAKLATATSEADRFYGERLPGKYSEVAGELGTLSKKAGVRLTRVAYSPAIVLAGTSAQLTEVRMDATLSGDYRPLVMFMNSLERDKMFFVINTVTLTGQQSGTVSLRLRLTTYLRAGGTQDAPPDDGAAKPPGPEAMNTGDDDWRTWAMKTGTDNRKDMMLWGVLGVFALGSCIYIYEEVFAGSSSAPAPSTVVVSAPVSSAKATDTGTATGKAAKTLGTTSAALDPTLHMDAMLVSESVDYSGTGRNIFSPNSAPPVVIPQPKAPARPLTAAMPVPVLPCPPNCPPPPPPPPIDLKFFGVETSSNGARKALLLQGENVFVASAGEIVMRRYKVISVGAKTIEVEDMQNNNKQTLPLLVN